MRHIQTLITIFIVSLNISFFLGCNLSNQSTQKESNSSIEQNKNPTIPKPTPKKPDTNITDPSENDDLNYTKQKKTTILPYSPLAAERGFYSFIDLLEEKSFQRVRTQDKCSLAFSYIKLNDYKTQDLPQSFLDKLSNQFELLREAGIKVILRFAYNQGPINAKDASKEQILKHIAQIKPILQENSDVIAVVQAGFIGAWGEWHSSSNNLLNNNLEDAKEILETLIDALPSNRYVQIRSPIHKLTMYQETLDKSKAFSLDYVARIGHHNDCFLADETDMGTYYPEDKIDFYKNYVAKETLFTPMGGETCQKNLPRSSCTNALIEMKKLHFSYLNQEYNQDVLQNWKDDGCYDEILKNMGYRLIVHNVIFNQNINSNKKFKISFQIENQGFAAPFNPRALILTFKNKTHKKEINLLHDMRILYPDTNKTINYNLLIDDLPKGEYDLFLSAPDPSNRLKDDPRYSLSFVNTEFNLTKMILPIGKVKIKE